MKLHHWITTLLCSALFTTPALAEKQISDELPWYEVEIIIFTRDIQPASLNEEWPSNPGTPDFDNAHPLQTNPADEIQALETAIEEGIDDLNSPANLALQTTPAEATDENRASSETSGLIDNLPTAGTTTLDLSELPAPTKPKQPEPYALLLEDDFKLKTEFKRLQRSTRLQPEIHLAWRQPVTNRSKAQLLYLRTPFPTTDAETELEREIEAEITAEAAMGNEILSTLGNTAPAASPNLEGTLRVSVNRYLHVDLDLLSRAKQVGASIPYEQSFEGGYTQSSQIHTIYRMQTHRRMRSGELHYLDHPLMGALIKITPYELPIIPTEAEIATEPSAQGEEADTAEADNQVPTPLPQEPGTTRSSMEIPLKAAE